eukprot:symbB.v1.2.007252.t1/scaffold401.1/size211429/23
MVKKIHVLIALPFTLGPTFSSLRQLAVGKAEEYQKLKALQLKDRLKALGLPTTGCKALLQLRLAGREHRVEVDPLSDRKRLRVRWALKEGNWNLTVAKHDVQPARSLGRGSRNPLCDLGECGDINCALYRFRAGSEGVRGDFVNFCTKHIEDHFLSIRQSRDDGLVYCSLGCGSLYFDWELLNLLQSRLSIAQVWLVDPAYRGNASDSAALRALTAFGRWFSGDFDIHYFVSAKKLTKWAAAFGERGRAHVVMQCDSVQTFSILDKDRDFCSAVLAEDAINLQIFSQRLQRRRPGPGRRRGPVPVAAVRSLRRFIGTEKEEAFETLECDRWQNGTWVPEFLCGFHAEDLSPVNDWVEEELERRYR